MHCYILFTTNRPNPHPQSYQLLANTAPVQGAILIVLGPSIDYLITGHKVMQYTWTGAAAAVMVASCSVAVLVNISQVGGVLCKAGRGGAVLRSGGSLAATITFASCSVAVLDTSLVRPAALIAPMSLSLLATAAIAGATTKRTLLAASQLLTCPLPPPRNIFTQFMCLGRFSAVTFQVLGHTKTILVLLISWLALHEHMSGRKLFGMALAVAGMVGYGHFNSKAPAAGAKQAEVLPLLNKQRVTSEGEVRCFSVFL